MLKQEEIATQELGVQLSSKGFPREKMISRLEEYFGTIPFGGKDTFSNYPIKIDQKYIKDIEQLGKILHDVLVKIVYNYTRDTRIQDVIRLDRELQEIILMAEGTPFELGMYRPDFIFDTNGQAKICEIGCRYPINGWMLSYYYNLIAKEFASSVDKQWSEIPEQENFLSEFSNKFDSSEPIFIVHNKELGREVHYLKKELIKKGIEFFDVKPDEIQLIDKQLKVKNLIARQFYFEMDREEFKTFNREVLKTIITSGKCINDIRTILLIHDRRILTVLFNEEIISNYLDQYDYSFLKPFLIPSFTINEQQDRDYLIQSSENWVLKKNHSDCGTGIHFKHDSDPKDWQEIVNNNWQNYMVQQNIEQKEFSLGKEKINIVGMNLYFNEKAFGPGFFKGSSENIINLHNGKGTALPCILDKTA